MSESRNELERKLLEAHSTEEVMAIMKDAGVEASAEEAEKAFEKVKEHRDSDGRELSLDELEAVAGGKIYNYTSTGCQATVEFGSDCWGVDGGCTAIHNEYYYGPVNVQCECGRYMHKEHLVSEGNHELYGVLKCYYCGREIELDPRVYRILVSTK